MARRRRVAPPGGLPPAETGARLMIVASVAPERSDTSSDGGCGCPNGRVIRPNACRSAAQVHRSRVARRGNPASVEPKGRSGAPNCRCSPSEVPIWDVKARRMDAKCPSRVNRSGDPSRHWSVRDLRKRKTMARVRARGERRQLDHRTIRRRLQGKSLLTARNWRQSHDDLARTDGDLLFQ